MIFQSVYVVHIFHFCMVSIAFLKKISPKILVFYSFVNVQNIPNHLFFSIAFMA